MHDPRLVSRVNRFGEFHHECRRLRCRLRCAGKCGGKRAAFHQFHREEGTPLVIAAVVDLDNAGVMKLGNCFRLATKTRAFNFIGERAREQHLQSDRSAEPDMYSAIHDTHSATA